MSKNVKLMCDNRLNGVLPILTNLDLFSIKIREEELKLRKLRAARKLAEIAQQHDLQEITALMNEINGK